MKLIELDKEKLDNFLIGEEHSQFSQSYDWGEFQREASSGIFRYGIEEEGTLLAVISLIKKRLFFGFNYFYAPRGPIVKLEIRSKKLEEVIEFLFIEIEKIAQKEKCIFLRFEPQEKLQVTSYKLQVNKTIDLQPAKTLILDLSKSEEEVLGAMHQKTRYNIRLAEKKGVEIVEAGENDFESFWKLMEETNKRDGFRLHGKKHYKNMLRVVSYELQVKLYLAKYQGKILSANIISFFGDTATYMHGASSNEHRNVMAPYLLQWEIIKKSKNFGYKYYDFFGIDEEKWPGVTRYKKGFCEKNQEKSLINYPGTYDFVFSKVWYNVYKVLRKLRRLV